MPLFVPAELVVVAAGVAAETGHASLAGVVASTLLADVCGALALFTLAKYATRSRNARVTGLLDRASRIARRARAHSVWTILVGRCVPLLRSPSACAAGLLGMPTPRFATAAVAASCVWTSVFVGLGYALAGEPIRI